MQETELACRKPLPRPGERRTNAGRALLAWLAARTLTPRWIPVALSLVTFAVFSPALGNGFVKWDDYVNLFENPHFRGLHWTHIRWMFTSILMGHYIPVTWLTFGLDYTLWGMNPFGYHLTNLLIHAANAALFYLVAIRLLTKATSLTRQSLQLAGATAALFFALHPLRAESVAWATERRDVLSGLFFLLTVLTYLRAAESEGRRRGWLLAGSLGCYVLALASKSIVMTLPLVLALLDCYPLGRLQWRRGEWARPAARAALLEKVPYVALGLLGAGVSYYAVAAQEYLTSLEKYPWPARVGMTAFSLWFYFERTVVPFSLSLLYELPARVDPLAPRFLGSALGVLAISGIVLALRRRWPAGLAAWIYYGIVLGPVTGIVHSGHQLTHDRYSYLSCLGWGLLVGAAVGCVARGGLTGTVRPSLGRAAAAVTAAWILALATLTWYQVQVWRDTETLWRYGAESDPTCSICQVNLGDALLQRKLYGLAREHYELALTLRPDRTRVYSDLGVIQFLSGDTDGAMALFSRALASHPNDASVLSNIGMALINQKRYAEAISYLRLALRAKPDYAPALTNFGVALIETSQPGPAVPYLLRSAEIKPREPMTRADLVRAYLALGDASAALELYQMLKNIDPDAARLLQPALFSVW